MGANRAWRAFGVTASVLLGAPAAAAETDRAAVIVHVDDRAQVPARELANARGHVERVFRDAGVEITWGEPWSSAAIVGWNAAGRLRHVAVVLVIGEEDARGATRCALGVAMPALATASVFYNRIASTAQTRPVDADLMLGRVIAHEVGHLLLPAGSHSRYGIMRADLDLDFVNPDRFSDEQARTIRAALLTRSARR
jgi:hypothetical protein